MTAKRHVHARVEGAAFRAPGSAVARAGGPCDVIVDGMTVRVDNAAVCQPDVILRCGPVIDGDALEVPDPLILVEVVSPSSAGLDTNGKLGQPAIRGG